MCDMVFCIQARFQRPTLAHISKFAPPSETSTCTAFLRDSTQRVVMLRRKACQMSDTAIVLRDYLPLPFRERSSPVELPPPFPPPLWPAITLDPPPLSLLDLNVYI
jgi:hypothetical protein